MHTRMLLGNTNHNAFLSWLAFETLQNRKANTEAVFPALQNAHPQSECSATLCFSLLSFIKLIASDQETCNRSSNGYRLGKEISGLSQLQPTPANTCSRSSSLLQNQRWNDRIPPPAPLAPCPKALWYEQHQHGSVWGPRGWGGITGIGDTLHPPLPHWGGRCPACVHCASPVLTRGPGGPLGPSFPVSPGGPRAPGGPGGPGGPVAPSRP